MRSFTISICTLALVSLVFAAPTAQNNAIDCFADGTCVDGNDSYPGYYAETNDKRSVIGDQFDFFECLDDDDGGIPQVILTTTQTRVAETAVAFQLTPTPASAPHNSDGGLLGLGGLLGGLLGSSDHTSAPAGIPLSGLTSNGNPVDDLTHHLIDLDLDATASVGDLLQATATATLGLL